MRGAAGSDRWPKEAQLLEELDTRGYVILRKHLDADVIARLLQAARKLASTARAGGWPYLRTCPKQFPPWETTPDAGVWGVQHLLHPDLFLAGVLADHEAAAFAELYFSDLIIGPVKDILQVRGRDVDVNDDVEAEVDVDVEADVGDEHLIMELFNMLVAPPADFCLRWHRDDVSFALSTADEAAALGLSRVSTAEPAGPESHSYVRRHAKQMHAQYNIPLLPDRSLHVVPGSHLRPRTAGETARLAVDAYADNLPGWIEVSLSPGDVVFYDNNLIHRGVYSASVERFTLHGSVGDVAGGRGRSRNVLQHGVGGWVGRCSFETLLTAENPTQDDTSDSHRTREMRRTAARAEKMRRNLVRLGDASGEGGVGFAHED